MVGSTLVIIFAALKKKKRLTKRRILFLSRFRLGLVELPPFPLLALLGEESAGLWRCLFLTSTESCAK